MPATPCAYGTMWGPGVFRVPERSQANLCFEFSLCSHQFSTWTHPSSPQVSCDLENTCSLVCQLSLAFLAKLGESCLGAAPFQTLSPLLAWSQRSPGGRRAAFAPVLACVQGPGRGGLHPVAACAVVGTSQSTAIFLEGLGAGPGFLVCLRKCLIPRTGGARGSFLPFCHPPPMTQWT